MRHTLTVTEALCQRVADAVFDSPGLEGAAYLLCGVSETGGEVRLLARDVIPVRPEHYLVRERDRLSIAADSYVPVAKRARLAKEAILFVHSHPGGYPDFSIQDDREEPKLLAFFHSRAPELPHGSMLFSSRSTFHARAFLDDEWSPFERIRAIGRRFRFVDRVVDEEPIPEFFDRQIKAFGPDIQRLLRRLHIGVVGAGGTGSAVIEQLTRLGVGTISTFDRETLDESNVTRVYGSKLSDAGALKTQIQKNHVDAIGFKTKINPFPNHITDQATAKRLRDCDLIFACTDKQAPRGILNRLALRYLIPVFDVAVKLHSENQIIRGIWGRVTTLIPGEACLLCRERIDPGVIRAESLPKEQRDRELAEGYITELATDEPAVVMFTSAVAAQAVSELLHRLTGFMSGDRQSTEVIMFFHESRIRTNRVPPNPDCMCQRTEHWGRGDSQNFLGYAW